MTLTNVLSSSTIAKPEKGKSRIQLELEQLHARSTAHLPSTSAQPHVPVPRKERFPQPEPSLSSSAGSSSSDAQAKKSPGGAKSGGVKAKASSKQKKRSKKEIEKAMDFKEKLEIKAREVEERKLKRDRAKKIYD